MFHIIALVSLLGFMNKATASDVSPNGTEGKVILYLCKYAFVINKVCCGYIWLTRMANGLEKKTISSVPLSNFIFSGIILTNTSRPARANQILLLLSVLWSLWFNSGKAGKHNPRETQQSFIRRCSAHRSNPLPFYNPFLTETIRPLYSFCWQIAPVSWHTK